MAGRELRLGTTSMYMTTYITRFDANQDKNTNLHGYILGSERKLIAQNQALERVNRGKFSLEPRLSAKIPSPTCFLHQQNCVPADFGRHSSPRKLLKRQLSFSLWERGESAIGRCLN